MLLSCWLLFCPSNKMTLDVEISDRCSYMCFPAEGKIRSKTICFCLCKMLLIVVWNKSIQVQLLIAAMQLGKWAHIAAKKGNTQHQHMQTEIQCYFVQCLKQWQAHISKLLSIRGELQYQKGCSHIKCEYWPGEKAKMHCAYARLLS